MKDEENKSLSPPSVEEGEKGNGVAGHRTAEKRMLNFKRDKRGAPAAHVFGPASVPLPSSLARGCSDRHHVCGSIFPLLFLRFSSACNYTA